MKKEEERKTHWTPVFFFFFPSLNSSFPSSFLHVFYSHFLQALLLPCPQPITPAATLLLLQNLFFVLAHELQPCLALDLMADLPPQACP